MTTCPTCGSPVHVQTGDEGTSSYRPICLDVLRTVQEILADCGIPEQRRNLTLAGIEVRLKAAVYRQRFSDDLRSGK